MPRYSYSIIPYQVSAAIEAADSNDLQSIAYAGSEPAGRDVDAVKFRLSDAYGAFGHRFNIDESTPTDLDAALLSTFGPDAIERTGAIPDYDPQIPEGAQT